MESSTQSNLDEYSASSTTIKFDNPLPLLRGPVPASQPDDPTTGPYVLAFRNRQSWESAYKLCESKLLSQCEGGARIGCAVSASEKCKPPWWRRLVGMKLEDLKEREICEEREIEECLVGAREKCIGFAKDKCFGAFCDARIAVNGEIVRAKIAKKLGSWVLLGERSEFVRLFGFDRNGIEITNLRACEMLGSDCDYEWFFKGRNC